MARVAYVCNRYPFLKIGRHVWFEGGLFATEDPDLQKLIESNDSFNTYIFFQDPPDRAKVKAEKAEKDKMQGGYRTEEAQDASRKLAKKLNLDDEETEEMIKARMAITANIQNQMLQRKRGRPPKVKENLNV